MNYYTLKLFTSIFLLFTSTAFAEKITTRMSTNVVVEGDTFTLTLSSKNSMRPDLTPLNTDFTIAGTFRNSSVMIIDGKRTSRYEWRITLLAKHSGELTVPALKVGKDESSPSFIKVIDSSQAPKARGDSDGISIASRINGESKTFHVFQEIPITVRIETSRPLLTASIVMPEIEGAELIPTDKLRRSQQRRNGQIVQIVENEYTLRPQQAGKIDIPPFSLRGEVPERRSLPSDNINRFLSGPFSRGRRFVVRGNSLTLEAHGKANANDWFLPAKSVSLRAQWLPKQPTFKQGEAFTRIVLLSARGARAEQLPKLTLPDTEGVKFYIDDDRTKEVGSGEARTAVREVVLSIVPTRDGQITLPAINVDWLNTKTNQPETATLPAEIITVIASKTNSENTKTPSKAPIVEATNTDDDPKSTSTSFLHDKNGLFIGIVALFISLTGGLWVWKKGAFRQQFKNTQSTNETIHKELMRALKQSNPKALYKALLSWQQFQPQLKDNQPIQSLIDALGEHIYHPEKAPIVIDFSLTKQTIIFAWRQQTDSSPVNTLPPLYESY